MFQYSLIPSGEWDGRWKFASMAVANGNKQDYDTECANVVRINSAIWFLDLSMYVLVHYMLAELFYLLYILYTKPNALTK